VNQNSNFIIPKILLHPNIPKPMHGVNPRSIKGQEWWDQQRQVAYAKNNYCCWACGVHKSDAKFYQWLEAHEAYEIDYFRGRMILHEITALCHACHNYIHDGRMIMMVRSGGMVRSKYDLIRAHGDAILASPDLQNAAPPLWLELTEKSKKEAKRGGIAEWQDWRLVLEDIEYPPLYKSYEEWHIHFVGRKA